MDITILALGSHGDVQPFIPLGRRLQSIGHRVRIATFELFRSMVQEAGLGFHPIHGDAQALLQTAAAGHMLKRYTTPLRLLATLYRSYGSLAASLPDDIAKLPPTDLVLNQLPSHLFGGDLAEYFGVRWAVVSVIPLVRTRLRPLIGFPTAPSFLPAYNLLTYRIGEQIGWQLFRRAVNRLRTKLWGMPAQPFWGSFEQIHQQQTPFICGFSEHVVSRAPDWGKHIHLTGWWYPDNPAWQPAHELIQFLDAGPAPVFIGFGSMPVADPDRLTTLIRDAVSIGGFRAILHAGWAGLGGALPPEIFPMTYAPYDWLFPRMAAIVHHGGSGTSGMAFRAGVPTLIVPFGFDQFYWGARAHALGVGPQPLPFRKLTAEHLAAAIQAAVSNKAMHQQAASLGYRLSSEDGLGQAVEVIERLA
jgi:UDP:flavonoid glycosyltransferase YjiC (YdhE family)